MSLRSQSPEVEGLAQQSSLDVVSDAPSFFEDVQGQGPLQSIEHFCRSHQSYQRLAYSQGIAAAAAAVTAEYEDCVELLLPLVQQLAQDQEVEIRGTAVKQLPGIGSALYAKDAERSMRDIEGTLLVCAQQCALDDEDEVSHAAILSFQQLVQLLPSARATAASKRAVDRLESQGSDDGTLAAVRLLAHTVAFWTPEALRRHVPRYIGRWTSHREFAVREAVATCMSLAIQPMPLRLCHQVLLPAFYQLSRDQNWRVRRACSLDLPRLAEALHKRPADSSCSSSSGSCYEGSSSNWQQEVEVDQPLGCCSSRPSSCLSSLQRFGTEVGGVNANLLAASLAAAAGPQRNRSYPSLIAHRSPASTAEIMTKHPMHSSLITDGLLSGSSSCASMPGSPSAGSDVVSLAQDSHDDACTPLEQHQQHHHHHHVHAVMSDTEQEQQHHSHHHPLRSHQQQQQPQQQCKLEAKAGLLHDCWCALRQCMELLTADSSHWVKVAALSGLGPFLLQLPHCQLGQLLLGRFTSMAGSTVVIYEVSVALACAQAFGQLAVLLGPDRWPDVRDAWHALQSSRDPAVLCEVVSCLPQLMAALGPVLTQQEMVPALAGLLQSHISWIGGQLVNVMADLLAHLPSSGHELLLKTLPQLATSTGDRTRSWRMRRDLALQLGRLAAVAGPDAIENSLWPTAMSLCCDPVAAVRTAAARQVGPILAALPSHMLHLQGEAAAGLDNCAASTPQGLNGCSAVCQPGSRLSLVGSSSSSVAEPVDPAAAPPPADVGSQDHSRADSHSEASASRDSTAAGPPARLAHTESGGTHRGSRSSSDKDRSSSLSVRFALSDACPATDSSSSSASNSTADRQGLGSSRLTGLVAAAGAEGCNSGARSSSGCSSMEFDELELPSALAPAPAGCFSNPSDSDNDSDPDDAACGTHSSGSSSGLSSSSSRSSDAGSHHGDSGSSSSSDDESGNDNGSDSDEDDSSSGGQRWRGVLSTPEQAATGAGNQSCSSDSSSNGLDGALQPTADTGSGGADSPSPAAALPRPQHAMHPAMMPVGALSAAAAAALGSAPRPVPASKRLASNSRAKSTGDLARLPGTVSSSNPEDRRLGDTVVGRFKQQHGGRQLADSLPNTLLAAAEGSSDDDSSPHSSNGPWSGVLPQPAHAAPHQYLPVLVEYFGCSSRHQQRQLFVPLAMGLLANCHRVLSCAQQAVLLDRLEALAHDAVPGVRYAVAAALADVREAAAAVAQSGQQQQQPQQQQASQEAAQGRTDADTAAATPAAAAATAAADSSHVPDEPQQAVAESAEAAFGAAEAADGAAERMQLRPSTPPQQQPEHRQQPAPVRAEEQPGERLLHQPTSEPQLQQEPPQVQVIGHVPKGAHPLLGYQAYVQQLATVAGVKTKLAASRATNSSSSDGSSSGTSSSGTGSGGTSSGTSTSSTSSTSSKRVSWGSLSVVSIAPPASNGRASPAPLPQTRASPAAASSRQQAQPKPAAIAGAPAAAKQQPSGAAVPAASTPGAGTGVAAPSGAAVGAEPAGDSASQVENGEAAEWLRKLSNCQQLERLMHVVALTTGPL